MLQALCLCEHSYRIHNVDEIAILQHRGVRRGQVTFDLQHQQQDSLETQTLTCMSSFSGHRIQQDHAAAVYISLGTQ